MLKRFLSSLIFSCRFSTVNILLPSTCCVHQSSSEILLSLTAASASFQDAPGVLFYLSPKSTSGSLAVFTRSILITYVVYFFLAMLARQLKIKFCTNIYGPLRIDLHDFDNPPFSSSNTIIMTFVFIVKYMNNYWWITIKFGTAIHYPCCNIIYKNISHIKTTN